MGYITAMYKFISIIDGTKIADFDEFVERLESLGCTVKDKHKLIGVIAGECPMHPSEIKIEGLTAEEDTIKKVIADPESDIQ